MFRIRNARDVDDFVGAPDDPTDYAQIVEGLWESGASSPEWCFVAEGRTGRRGRLGFRTSPTTTDPRWLGTLPPEELFIYGLWLPWTDPDEPGNALLSHAIQQVGSELPALLELRINAALHDHPDERAQWAERIGMELFQEKQGFEWLDDGERIDLPPSLALRSIDQVGADTYRWAMASCGARTLDRNDRYYWDGCGSENWAAQMTEFLVEDDAPMWLLGYGDAGPVGYIAVGREDDLASTIVHVGVLPAQRGHGHIDDLLQGGTATAQRLGIDRMLSDVDVLNSPMMAAMRRAGHSDRRTDWHVWVYRARLEDMM